MLASYWLTPTSINVRNSWELAMDQVCVPQISREISLFQSLVSQRIAYRFGRSGRKSAILTHNFPSRIIIQLLQRKNNLVWDHDFCPLTRYERLPGHHRLGQQLRHRRRPGRPSCTSLPACVHPGRGTRPASNPHVETTRAIRM